MATLTTPSVSVRVVEESEGWDRLAGAWNSLFEASPMAATPLRFDWMRTWWDVYMATAAHSERAGLRVITCWRGDALIGVLPLYASSVSGQPFAQHRLRFISTGEDEREETCPDYMNLLAMPGEEAACVAAVEHTLSRQTWDLLELLDIPQESALLACSFETIAPTRPRVVPRGVCPIADLSGGFETYLQRLSSNTRQQARRFLRESERCGARLEFATPHTVAEFFDDLVRLHQARWATEGKPGCFSAERFARFHRRLLDLWIGDGRAVVARLRVGTDTLAAFHGFVTGGKFDFYQCGVRIGGNGPFKSPGTAGHLLLMRALSERGVRRYDFLRGASEYKDRLATDRVPLFSLHVSRARPTIVAKAAQLLAKAAWRGVSRESATGAKSDLPRGTNRNMLVSAFVRTGGAATLSLARRWRGVMALNYHRIGDARGSLFDHGLWSASEEQFDCQVRLLKQNFDVISTAELGAALSHPKGRYVLITFDDGYRDNYERAFKILSSHRAPATFFVTTGFIDSPRLPWWDEIAWMVRTSRKAAVKVAPYTSSPIRLDTCDRERAVRALLRIYKSLPSRDTDAYLETVSRATGAGRYGRGEESLWMTWDMLREMQARGMVIGGHTVDHTILARMDPEAQRSQIVGCATRLREELGTDMDSFSYPVGHSHDFNQATRDCLKECGVKYAFSYYGGMRTTADWDPYDIRRIAVESDITFDQFRAITLLPGIFGRSHSVSDTLYAIRSVTAR